jgi:hypothetical protein
MVTSTSIVISGLVVYVLCSLIKPFLEASFLPSFNKDETVNTLHDPAIRLLALLLGIGAQVVNYLVFSTHSTAPGLFTAMTGGAGAALAAIGTFHITNSNYFDPGTSATPVPHGDVPVPPVHTA